MKYSSIHIYGNILSTDILNQLETEEISGQKPKDFELKPNQRIRDEISQAWSAATTYYKAYKRRIERLGKDSSGESETRNLWIAPLLGLLGYTLHYENKAQVLSNKKTYHITDPGENLDGYPVIIAGHNQDIDKKPTGLRMSPHALLQEFLNNTEEHLYGIVTNGRVLRLLRDSGRIIRLSYLEIDLEQMMEEDLYPDFAVMFRLLHATRMPQKKHDGPESLIEKYHQDALESGTRIRDNLSHAVENAILIFGNGFLKHPANDLLRKEFSSGSISSNEYYQLLLRLIYRLLFLMVTEERELIYPETKDEGVRRLKDIYYKYYSVSRIRKLTGNNYLRDDRYDDIWKGLRNTFKLFEEERFGKPLGIKPLNGDLFSEDCIYILEKCQLNNKTLLDALFYLSYFEHDSGQYLPVNYKLLNVEEFGSVYEGLLEYDPKIERVGNYYEFSFIEGTGRSSSGSHYTPEELVQPLIKHSLDYILEERESRAKKEIEQKNVKGERNRDEREAIVEKHFLDLKVGDVTCGSGHILLSAARRIAYVYASLVEESDQPTPSGVRQAIRKIIKNCIYGVDKNPLAVELCKVALWLEAHIPGEPLSFLDHHIKCGDAIVGLARIEELEKGIANEAFKALPGDDKEVARAFGKRNKQEREQREQEVLELEEKVSDNVKKIIEETGLIEKLPERTPEEIKAKRKKYYDFTKSTNYARLKALADMQVAQFFIPKTFANKPYLCTDTVYRKYLENITIPTGQSPAKADAIAQKKKFFHYFLEFPEVFAQGGFHCFLGNPPFLGGKRISTHYGDRYLNYLTFYFFPHGGITDLVAYFFRRTYNMLGKQGFLGLISTNTISQGDTRRGGLGYIITQGGIINYALKSIRWPGEAAVYVSLVCISKKEDNIRRLLNNKGVNIINSGLEDNPETPPFRLEQNKNISFIGNYVLGKGFILSKEKAFSILSVDNKYNNVIFEYLNGEDLNKSPNQKASRMIINFFDWDIEKVKNYPICFEIIDKYVKPSRKDKKEKKLSTYWWRYARQATELRRRIKNQSKVLVTAQVSKTGAFCFVPNNQVFDAKLIVFAISNYHKFSILQSCIHLEWAWTYGTTMKTDLSYGPTNIYETFPFPQQLKQNSELVLENIGNMYHQFRQQLMLNIQLGLTKTYNLFHNPNCNCNNIEKAKNIKELKIAKLQIPVEEAIQQIEKLRDLHKQMDEAALKTYGWHEPSEKWGRSISLRHDFYEVDYLPENDRIRYTIHPDARREVLKRLLQLNHEIYAEEVKQGLHDKKKGKKKRRKKKIQEEELGL